MNIPIKDVPNLMTLLETKWWVILSVSIKTLHPHTVKREGLVDSVHQPFPTTWTLTPHSACTV